MRGLVAVGVGLWCLASGAAWAATPFDGVYRGNFENAGGPGMRCPAGAAIAFTVRDGAFTWRLPAGEVSVPVGIDGSFSAQNGSRFVNGRITDGRMTARTTGGPCFYTWTLAR